MRENIGRPQPREEESVEWSAVRVIGEDSERANNGTLIENPLPLLYARIGVFRRAGTDSVEGCRAGARKGFQPRNTVWNAIELRSR